MPVLFGYLEELDILSSLYPVESPTINGGDEEKMFIPY